MAETNGAALPGLGKPALNPASQSCVDLLNQLLSEALAGKITTIGVIACGDAMFGTVMAGPDAARLHLGAGVLQQQVMQAATNPQNRSRIIQPGRR